jgi:hypothetical protein
LKCGARPTRPNDLLWVGREIYGKTPVISLDFKTAILSYRLYLYLY